VDGKIRWYDAITFAGPDGRRAAIRLTGLPAPFHLAPSFAAFPFLDWKDKSRIAKALFHIARNAGRLEAPAPMTMLDWLKEQKQTPRAIDRFWTTVLVSALNEELASMDAGHGIAVFWKAFISNPHGFAVGIPGVPLSALYAFKHENIAIRTRATAAEVLLEGERGASVRLEDGSEVRADYCILATSFDRTRRLLPAELRDAPQFAVIANLCSSPITSVHFWFDRPVMQEPFIAVLDRTTQWVFNRTLLGDGGATDRQYLQLVISASYALSGKPQREIAELCRTELAEIIPATRHVEPMRFVVVRENNATFSPRPQADRWRPPQRTPLRNLFIAGDWTQTGWPATMEGAVRSGYQAAEKILALEGRPSRLVQPELPATGLVSWIARKH
jgi:squalene-associated FAD-dependent desaturase